MNFFRWSSDSARKRSSSPEIGASGVRGTASGPDIPITADSNFYQRAKRPRMAKSWLNRFFPSQWFGDENCYDVYSDDDVKEIPSTPSGSFNHPKQPPVIDLTKDEEEQLCYEPTANTSHHSSVVCLDDEEGEEDDNFDEGEESVRYLSDAESRAPISSPKARLSPKPTSISIDSAENTTPADDDITVVAEIPVSPDVLNRRRSFEEVIRSYRQGGPDFSRSLNGSECGYASDSLSLVSGMTNGGASPTPEDSISRQATPKGYKDYQQAAIFDHFRRRLSGSVSRASRMDKSLRSPKHIAKGSVQKRAMRELSNVPFSKLSAEAYRNLVVAAGKVNCSAYNLVEDKIISFAKKDLGSQSATRMVRNPQRMAAGGRKFYLDRVQKVLMNREKPIVSSVEYQDDDDSESRPTESPAPLTSRSGTETPRSCSTLSNASRDKLDGLLIEVVAHSAKDSDLFRRVQKHKTDVTSTQNRELELTEKAKLCAHSFTKNRADIVEDLRKELSLLGIKLPKKKIVKDEFPELPFESDELYERVMGPGNENEQFSEGFGLKITRKDLRTLKGSQWLNDEIINFYLQLVCDRNAKQDALPKVYAFNTFFYVTLCERGFAGVKRWTRKVDIFSFEVLLVPIHVNKIHWCMSVIDLKEKRIEYYDSLHGSNQTCLENLKLYLCDESKDKKKIEFDLIGWDFEMMDCPRQDNGSDCGVFSCKFADFAARREQIVFNHRHMPYYRKRMLYEIVTKQLLV